MKTLKRMYLAGLLTHGALLDRSFYLKMVREEGVFSLESYFKTNAVTKIFENNSDIKVFLDSGAHSLVNKNTGVQCLVLNDEQEDVERVYLTVDDLNKLSLNDRISVSSIKTSCRFTKPYTKLGAMKTGTLRRFIDHSYNDTEEVKRFFENYIAFIHKWEKHLICYVNLDVIFNPERSWENQKYMESQGLHPLPVYHFGEDKKWLRKYMDEYDYIGVGGLGQDINKRKFISTFGDSTWKYILASKQKVRIHGFAVSAFEVLKRYGWYSSDSTTWVKHAAYGNILVPGINPATREFDVNCSPALICVSDVKIRRKTKGVHYTLKYNKIGQERLLKYFADIGVDVKKLGTDLFERTKANIKYFQALVEKGIEVDEKNLVTSRRTFFE